MWTTSELIAVGVLLAVIGALVIGFLTMGETVAAARENERIMAWRLVLQAAAVLVLILGALFLF